jgi:D-alanyl-D-alanine carboxypeptidase
MSKGLLTICFLLLIILICSSLWVFRPAFHTSRTYFLSPVPEFLVLKNNDQVKMLDFWKPLFNLATHGEEPLAQSAKAAILYDLTSNKALYEKKSTERLPMASLTKIMTAIIALENPKKDDAYIVHKEDLVGEDSMGLTVGENVMLEELLYGLMLRSGNDAAEVLASNYDKGRSVFIDAMNKKAIALGLTNTKFSNPSGLQGDGEQYTTAADLLVMTRYALENFPLFKTVVSTFDHTIEGTSTHKAYYLENETNLLSSYPGVKGVKTGYTPEAGLCLVTYLEYKDHKILGVLLSSENRREEMKEMLDYGLKKLRITPPLHD